MTEGGPDFSIDPFIVVPEVLPPLRMPEDHILTTQFFDHGSGDFPREGPLVFPEQVLRRQDERMGDGHGLAGSL